MKINIQYGDTSKTLAGNTGGTQTLDGLNAVTNYLYGDARCLTGSAKGGVDTLTGGSNGAINWIYGDAFTMSGYAVGGDDKIVGGLNAVNHLYGDAHTMGLGNEGGNDSLKIGQNLVIQMSSINDPLTREIKLNNNDLYGDAYVMQGSMGGVDELSLGDSWGISMATALASGEFANANASAAPELTIELANNTLIGDGYSLTNSTGGRDTLSIGDSCGISMATALASGSGAFAVVSAPPKLTITLSGNKLIGDGYVMTNSTGGDDELRIGTGWTITKANDVPSENLIIDVSDNHLIGDAYTMINSTGGNDTLTGADYQGSETYLTGDGVYANADSTGGDDMLISGGGTDHMWGDFGGKDNLSPSTAGQGGKDTFVFMANNGNDIIYDFHRSEGDMIELRGMNGLLLNDIINIQENPTVEGIASTKITLSDGNTITLVGVLDLSVADFSFT